MGIARAIANSIMQSLARQLVPGWQIIQTVRSLGYGYRYQEMLNDVRKFTGRVKYQTQITNLSNDKSIPSAWIVEEDFKAPYKYRVFGIGTVYNQETGEYEESMKSMFTNVLPTKGELSTMYYNNWVELEYEPKYVYERFEVVGVVRNPYYTGEGG